MNLPTASIPCTICGAALPAPLLDQPDSRRLSVTFDETFIDEHIQMHTDCTCGWSVETGDRMHDFFCKVHGVVR